MRREVAARMVAAWHKNYRVWREIKFGLLEAGEIPTTQLILDEIGMTYLPNCMSQRTKSFLAKHCSIVSDMLWNCKSDDKCIAALMQIRLDQRAKPVKPKYIQPEKIVIRWRDQVASPHFSDWKTVK